MTTAVFILSNLFTGILCVQRASFLPSVAKVQRRISMRKKRIGIYAGTFNPVHTGHIAFALQAKHTANLDEVYFLPERHPRHKQGVEHFAHRVAMLKNASKPHTGFYVLETNDIQFNVRRTLPNLQLRFDGAQLVFLIGSDVAEHLPYWPLSNRLLQQSELAIGIRHGQRQQVLEDRIRAWQQKPQDLHIIESFAPHVSSNSIRDALRKRRRAPGLLDSVARYSDRHWLYVSVA